MSQQPQSAASPAFLQALDTHLTLLRTHVDFLQALEAQNSPDETRQASSTLPDVKSMLQRATIALNDAQTCAQHYQLKESISTTSPLPVRAKRKSGVTAASGDGASALEGSARKRRRESSKTTAATASTAVPQAQRPSASAAQTQSPPPPAGYDTDPEVQLEYSDISAEVDARLQLREQRRAERARLSSLLAQSQSGQRPDPARANEPTKRKRKSSLGDSLMFTESELADIPETPGIPGLDGVAEAATNGQTSSASRFTERVEEEKEQKRNKRISAGGTRQIKKLKTRPTRASGRTSVLPLNAMSAPNATASSELHTEEKLGDKTSAQATNGIAVNGEIGVQPGKEGVRVPLNQSDGDGKMKKRRRSSGVPESQGIVEHKYANDDRSTKRRRR